MFLVVAWIKNIGGGGKIKFALALAACFGFFVLDANLIMNGSYVKRKKGRRDKPAIDMDDFIYASMKLLMDFILIFVLLV